MKLDSALLILKATYLKPPRRTGSERHPRWRWSKAHDGYLGPILDAHLARIWNLPAAEIQRRRKGCRHLRRIRTALVWTKAMIADLGHMTDGAVAARHGISGPAVCKKRQSLGVPRFGLRAAWSPAMLKAVRAFPGGPSSRASLGQPGDHPAIRAILRKAPDRVTATQLDISIWNITQWRMNAGIPAFTRARWTPKVVAQLGLVSDAVLAKRLAVDVGTVRYQRIKRGIPLATRLSGR